MKIHFKSRKIKREKRTVAAMIKIHCRDIHSTKRGLCPDCRELYKYASARLDKCPFMEDKPVCRECEIHCYAEAERKKITDVMKYSGPRMVLKHPLLAFMHLSARS